MKTTWRVLKWKMNVKILMNMKQMKVIIEVAVVNSYIWLSTRTGCHQTQKEYIVEIAWELVEKGWHLQSASQSELSVESLICLTNWQFSSKIEDQTNGKPHQQDCSVHRPSRRKSCRRKTTIFKCKQYDIPLCYRTLLWGLSHIERP